LNEWEPATEAEAAMREALAASDQEQYFRVLARTELVLPVSADALAGRAPMGWGTWTTGNRTHVLAFTSTAALRLCLNEPSGSYRPMPFHALAADWPNYEWWLAVNPGLLIESYLPSWFVSQLTRGDVRLPGRTMGARARMAQSDLAAALSGRVRASVPPPGTTKADAIPAEAIPAQPVRPGAGAPFGATAAVETVEAEIIDYPPPNAARAYASGTTVSVATAAGTTAAGTTAPGVTYGAESMAYADDAPTAPRPGLGAMLAGEDGAGTARARFAPAEGPNRGRVSIASVSEADYVAGLAIGSGAGEPAARTSMVRDSMPQESMPQESMPQGSMPQEPMPQGSMPHESIPRESVARDLVARELVAPASPATPAKSATQEVQDAEVVSVVHAWEAGFAPANETESNLLSAAEENNTDAFLSTLLLARVILPVPVGTPNSARPRDKDFPWQIDEMDGQPFVSVFTSPERLSEHQPARLATELSSVSLRFVQLIGSWPSEEIAFAINPGSPVGATLPGSQIVALAAWAREVGLRDEPAGEVMVAAKKNESTPAVGVAGAPAIGADRATVMQRTVPHAQVPFYLERGYDRVSGFVNRASEVAHLTSPKALYRALGLVYAASAFSEDDAEVHVVRWVAHRSDLYRLPYGGHHEAGMRAMQGWIIERPPFRGNGFAPGDTEVVAEFKVDSVRLPHGAQMWRLAKDGSENLVAMFDADTTKWVAPPYGYAGGGYA
jgi:hypothetical protein